MHLAHHFDLRSEFATASAGNPPHQPPPRMLTKTIQISPRSLKHTIRTRTEI